jgi:hypothetical protein
MTNQNPITPPPELVQKWAKHILAPEEGCLVLDLDWFANQAAQWGADQEMEQCLRYAGDNGLSITRMRAARRPKPPSLKQQALALIDDCTDPEVDYLDDNALSIIRRALEALPND